MNISWSTGEADTPPQIIFEEPPTPVNGSTVPSSTQTIVANISDLEGANTSSWIDFDRSLLGYWSMDYYNTTGIYDNSSHNNFGTFGETLGIEDLTNGMRGKGIKFEKNVDDNINIGMNINLSNFTISSWVKPEEENSLTVIVGKAYVYQFDVAGNGRFVCVIGNGYSWYGESAAYSETYDVGEWNLFTCSFNGTHVIPYLNGIPGTPAQTSNTPGSNELDSIIGRSYSPGYEFNGSLDEIMIFNRSLSSTEILALYNSKINKFNTTLTNLAEGQHNYTVYAIDEAGNYNSSGERNFIIGEDDTSPQIIYIYNSTEMTDISLGPNEGPFATYVQLNFTAYDAQGFGDLNDSSVQVNFSLAGEESRLNTSCSLLGDYNTNYANYTCNVTMWWWDAPGIWTINASIEDNNGNKAFNDSTTFSVGSTTGFLANSTQLTWPEINPGANNQEANEPLLLNNTGNTQVSIEVNATNLIGENNPTYSLGANNFSVHTAPGCEGTPMSRYEYTTVIGAIISKGNYTINDGTAQEVIYFCLETSNSNLISQPYSTKQEGNWIIRIFLAAFVVRRRKKNKKIQDDKLLKAINLIADELKEEYSLNKKEVIEIIIERLKKKYDLTRNEFLGIIKAREESQFQ
jgi:hypothetical protein